MNTFPSIVLSVLEADTLFGSDECGINIFVDPVADRLALEVMGLPAGSPLTWHVPPVFPVVHGSTFVATARSGDATVDFHFAE